MCFKKRIKLILLTITIPFLIPKIGWGNKQGNPEGGVKAIPTANAEDSKIIIDIISEDLWSDLQHKDEQCYKQLLRQHEEGTLSPLLQPYFSDNGLNVDSLIQDQAALTAYFETGCLRIHHKTFLVSDYPIDIDSRDESLRGEVAGDKLTPIATGVETEIRTQGDRLVVSYIIYSEILKNADLSKEYVPEKFQEIGYQLIPAWTPDTEYFYVAYRQNPGVFSLPATPGKIKGVRIQVIEGRRFKSKREGILMMRMAPHNHMMINLDFPLFEPY